MICNQLSFSCRLRRRKGKRSFSGTPRTPAKDCVLCTPVSFVANGVFEDALLHCIPRTPAKDCVLCTSVLYSVQLDCCQSFGGSVNLNWSYSLQRDRSEKVFPLYSTRPMYSFTFSAASRVMPLRAARSSMLAALIARTEP